MRVGPFKITTVGENRFVLMILQLLKNFLKLLYVFTFRAIAPSQSKPMSLEGGAIQSPEIPTHGEVRSCSQKGSGSEPKLHGVDSLSHTQRHSDATKLLYAKSDGQGNLVH